MAIDLVCNMEVDKRSTPFKSEYQGTMYYFCTALCRRVFNESPEEFIRKAQLSQKDLVCGMDVDPHGAHFTSQYRGRTYYFCSVLCQRQFEADPASFVRKA